MYEREPHSDFLAPPYTLLHEFVRPDGVREKHVIIDDKYTVFEIIDDVFKQGAALANPDSIKAQEVINNLYLAEPEQ